MDKRNFLLMVRNYLYDTSSLVWNDSELLQMTENAVKAYSEDTKFFHSQADFVPEKDGTYIYPDDFICFNAGWNSESISVKAISSYELEYYFPDPMNIKGCPEFIYDDISDKKHFRLCPDPAGMQNMSEEVYDYGILQDGDYGTESNSGRYGVVYSVVNYEFVGDMMYSRYASFEEIHDYVALIYHVLFQAFDTDAEFSDHSKAAYYKSMYKSRVAMFNQVKYKHNGRSAANHFF